MSTTTFKNWAKHSEHPLACFVRSTHRARHNFELPSLFCSLYRPVSLIHKMTRTFISETLRILYWTPQFKSVTHGSAKRLNLYGGLPFISGPLTLTCGDDCRISGATTFSARPSRTLKPTLKIGNNVGIGWQTTIAVGKNVILEDHVRMGGRNFLAGYPGHPLDAEARAKGLPDTEDQVGDIIIKKHAWIGTGSMIMAGVSIGEGTIVAAGSVVTKSLPPYVLAGGNPAKIIRSLLPPQTED